MALRILHVSQPIDAGVPAVVSALVADQLARGCMVVVACPPGPGLADRVERLGAEHRSWPATRSPGATVPGEVRRLRHIVDAVDPDIVVLHSAKAGLAGRLAIRGSRPTVYAPHAWSFEAVTGALAAAAGAWEAAASRWTDAVVCVSADERDRGLAVGVTAPLMVIPNGVDLQELRPEPAARARKALGLAQRPTVVCVGRLAEQKGQDLLLEAWPGVIERVPNAQLLLVGDGPRRAALEAVAPAGTMFTGTRADVSDLLAAADVVALPSRWESTPIVSLEAMAKGRPVVAFDVDGVRDALGDTGVVLPVGDVAGLTAALAELLSAPAAARGRGRRARQRAERVADIRMGVQRWHDVLLSVADRTGSAPLRIVPVRSVRRAALAGLSRVDVAAVDGPGGRQRAAILSALGVPVTGGRKIASARALGAPVLAGASDEATLAAAARRPGAHAGTGPADDSGPPVSVVATVLNEGDALRHLVEDLLPQLTDGDEIVLVDGGSTDGSLDALPGHPALRVEVVPGAGISAGRNHGVRVAHNDLIVCTDAGCAIRPGFIAGFRRAFAVPEPPVMVSGVYQVLARNALEEAQSLACYPQPSEVRRPSMAVRAYTRLFGTGFDPRFAVGRCVAFTREAWKAVDGFPEHLATGEDVSFGLAVSRIGVVQASTDAVVGWAQRDGLVATWRMYRGYGQSSTHGGDRALLVRDSVRGLAYLVAPLLSFSPTGRRLLGVGAVAYLSLPVVRAVKQAAPPSSVALLPVALATKDLGKLAGAVHGLSARRAR